MSNINLNIVGTGNFAQVEAAIKHLQSSIAQLNATAASTPLQNTVKQSVAQLNAMAAAQGLMKVHTTSLATEADRLTSRIAKGKTTFQDFKSAVGGATKANSVFMEVAKKQIAIQQMSAIQVGKNIYGYENLGRAQLKGAAAAQAHATAIAASNAVMRQSMVHVINWGKNMQWTGRQLTMGLTMPLVLFGAQAAKIFNEVDKNLTKLSKVYGVGLAQPTTAALASIRKEVVALSVELGKALGISSAEVTDIAAQFAAAGLQGEQLVYATKQAARMVILGEADKQEAINATISLQTAYKLNTQELTEAVNFFNAAQAATSTNMADLINAVPRVGPVVKQLGGTYKDMVAIITALKEGGVPAGEAANAIKNSLARIIQPTEKAKGVLLDFGIDIESIVNKNAGNLTATLLELQSGLLKLDGLTRQRAISELFGKYQFARMSAFIQNFGQVGTQSQKVMEMMGLSAQELATIADEQTKKIQQSASGRFKIAVETLKNTMLPIGEATLEIFTKVLEKVTAFFEAINNLPGPVKTLMKGLLLIGGVVGPVTMIAGLLGNLIGTIGMGIVRFKVFGGALRMLFATRDVNAAKIILSGFKELDPAVTAASKAINIFKNEELSAEQVGERFTAMLNEMTGGLIKIQDSAVTAGSALSAMTSQAASAGAAAASQMLFPLTAYRTPKGRIQGFSEHHYLPASLVSSTLGITTEEARARNRLGFSRYMPADLGVLQGAVSTTPLVYGSRFAGSLEQIQQSIVSQGMTKESITAGTKGGVSPQKWSAIVQEGAKRLPIDIDMVAKEYGTLFAQMSVGAETGGKALNTALQKIRMSVEAGVHFSEQNLQEVSALINETIMSTPASAQKFGLVQQEYAEKIRMAFNNASSLEMGNAELIRVIDSIQLALASKTGMLDIVNSEMLKLANAFQMGTYSSAGAAGATAPAINRLTAEQIRAAATTRAQQFAATARSARTNFEQTRSAVEGARKPILPFGPAATRYAENQTRYMQYEQEYTAAQKELTTLRKRLLQIESQQLQAAEASKSATEKHINAQKTLSVAESELATAIEERAIAESQYAGKNFGRSNAGKALDMKINQLLEQRTIAEAEYTIALDELNAAERKATTTTQQMDAARRKAAETEAALAAIEQEGIVIQEQVNTSGAARAISSRRLGMVGMGAGMLSMAPMMMGVHNETVNSMSMGLMMGSMAAMIPGIGTAAAVAIMAVSTLLPLIPKLIEHFNNMQIAAQNAFSVSAKEAEILGIKMAKLGESTLPTLTEEQKKASDAVSSFTDQIRQLDKSDPLKLFTESLKNKSIDEQMKAIQAKYLTLRIAGVNDEEAKNMVRAILRAAGLEAKTGLSILPTLNQYAGMTPAQIFAAQQMQNVGGPRVVGGGGKGGGQTITYGYDAQRTASNATNYATIIQNQGLAGVKMISDYGAALKQGSIQQIEYNRAVNKLIHSAGITSEEFGKLKQSGGTTADMLSLYQLRLSGVISTTEQWDRALKDSAYRQSLIAQQQFTEAQSTLAKDLATTLKTTSKTYTPQSVKSVSLDKQISNQKTLVDQLQKELDLRKKILDAQDKANNFAMSQSQLQQKYNEAVASGNLGEAAQIKRQMLVDQVKYNQELKTTALQNKLDAAKEKQSALEKKKSTTTTVNAAKTITKTIDDVNSKYEEMIIKAKAQGKGIADIIQSWASELKNTFGGNIDKIKEKLSTFVNAMDATGVTQWASAAAAALSSVADANQRNIISYRVSNMLLWEKKSIPIGDAFALATQEVTGKYARFNQETNTINVAIRRGRGVQIPLSEFGSILPEIPGRAMGGLVQKYAMGGNVKYYGMGSFGGVKGPGSWTSDSIPAMVSNGEYVVNAAAVSRVGTAFMDSLNSLGYANSAPLMSIISATGSPIIPVELVRSNNGGSLYNDHSQIIVNVANSNASPTDIANAVYGAIQRRDNMNGSRTVIG